VAGLQTGSWVSLPSSLVRHPDRSGPILSSAPNCGASGRAVEGPLRRPKARGHSPGIAILPNGVFAFASAGCPILANLFHARVGLGFPFLSSVIPPARRRRDSAISAGEGPAVLPLVQGRNTSFPNQKCRRADIICFCACVAKEAVKKNEVPMCGKCTVCKQSGMIQMHKCCG
jgi:hypothetical protein